MLAIKSVDVDENIQWQPGDTIHDSGNDILLKIVSQAEDGEFTLALVSNNQPICLAKQSVMEEIGYERVTDNS